ncbi:hypothetical protein [Klebsiella aerogenes]|uniref:hypothetical protein n=1 Tax=Klebsiella aerogenes TaxID=548 RepID=UPI001F316BC9|nr:hypothetical protein [Klebsiella aerogenes]
MRDLNQCDISQMIVSYRAEINDGQELRDRGLLTEECDVLFLYGLNHKGEKRQLCWLEMSEQHDAELHDLLDSLPVVGVMVIIGAMMERRRSLEDMVSLTKAIKQHR